MTAVPEKISNVLLLVDLLNCNVCINPTHEMDIMQLMPHDKGRAKMTELPPREQLTQTSNGKTRWRFVEGSACACGRSRRP